MDEKAIKVLDTIMQFGPISGPNILLSLEKQGVSLDIKTVRNIIDDWNTLFSYLGDGNMQIELVRNVGYSLNQSYFLPAEIRFLEDAIQSSNILHEQEKKRLITLLKIFNLKQEPVAKSEEGFLKSLKLIDFAIQKQRLLKFTYIDYYVDESEHPLKIKEKSRQHGNDPNDPSHEIYQVSPYEVMIEKGKYYLLSHIDKHPHDVTIFRIDRMRQLSLARKNARYTDKSRINHYDIKKRQMVNMYVGNEVYERIRLQFDKAIFRTIIDQFGTDLQLSSTVDGHLVLELTDFAISEGLIGWIMMMGNQIEVLEPEALRQKIYTRLQELINRYQKEEHTNERH